MPSTTDDDVLSHPGPDATGSPADMTAPLDDGGGRWRRHLVSARTAFAATWIPWLVARVITLGAVWIARSQVHALRKGNGAAAAAAHNGLLGFDAGWYRSIAVSGYGFARPSLRFFPLYPLVDRFVSDATRLPIGATLLLVSNASAFVGAMLVHRVAARELGDDATARRAVWLICLAPPAYVFVMGYSESLFVVLAIATFLCIRSDRWAWAGLWGFLAATERPIGVLLFLPVAIEGARTWPGAGGVGRLARVTAVVAPIAGLVTYLSWVAATYGGFLSPIRLQRYGVARSISGDPFVNAFRDARAGLEGSHIGTALHLPWIVLALALCVVAWRCLPTSYGVFAIAVVVAGLLGANFASFERYALSAFPLTIAAATLLQSRRVRIPVFVLCGVGLLGYGLLAFVNLNVP